MTLSTRLWLLGAALPVAVLAGVLVGSDRLLHLALVNALDRALLAQAAVESVSLFDGPGRQPHLHMATSPLVESVRPFAPEGALYGPDGRLVMRYPPGPGPDDALAPGVAGAPPVLASVERDGEHLRQLVVTVKDDSGQPFALRLSASMEQIDATTDAFHWIAVLTTLAAALVLVVVQLWQGRKLRGRLAVLRGHLEAVRAGDLAHLLPPDPTRDELAALREVLARATTALQHAQQAQERLLADAAHELRTPLTLMRTSLDLALRRERSPEELKAALQDTREELERLAALASRLLDTVAIGKGELEHKPADLSALALLAADAVRAAALERGVTVKVEAPERAVAEVHAESVRQAIDNLLSNALKFAPKGSEVRVGVRREGPSWVISVADAGPGIPKEQRAAMFEPFHRAPGSPGGAGLGLTIVREVARHHGGKAEIADVPQGTEVRLELPG